MHGFGKFNFLSGDSYEGNFSENHPHGRGKYIYKDAGYYEGDWLYGKKKGHGVI